MLHQPDDTSSSGGPVIGDLGFHALRLWIVLEGFL